MRKFCVRTIPCHARALLKELAPDPKSVSPSLSCRRYVIKVPPDLPTAQLGINPSDLLPHLDQQEAYRLISDVTVSPKLVRSLPPFPVPRLVVWAPIGILHNKRSVLAVLTNVGCACLYVLTHHEYREVSDISALWLRHCQASWGTAPRDNHSKLAELKTRADAVKLTALCWLGKAQDGAGWLAAASKSGLVSLWKVQDCGDTLLDVQLVNHFDCELKVITALHWTPLTSDNSLLVVSSLDGRVRSVMLSPPAMTAGPVVDIWPEQDRIGACHLHSWTWRGGLMLAAVKGAFVIFLHLSSEGQRQAYAAYRCCDTSVNGLSPVSADEVLVVTRSCRFTRLSLSLSPDGKLSLDTDNVESYINISHMGCYGLHMTQNNVICFVLLSVNQSYDHLRLREPSQVFVCSVSGLSEPQALLQDPQRSISQLWDCLELVRVQMLQKTLVLDVHYPRSVLDNMTIDQLTSTLWWTTFAAVAEEDDTKHQALLSLRCEVETLVVSCHFFKRVALLLSRPPDSLVPFQLQTLGLIRKWLLRLQGLPEELSTTLITGRTLLQQLKALEDLVPSQELCAVCGSQVPELREVMFSQCDQGHRVPRCSLSLVQCSQLPYWACGQCGALAHPLAVKECGVDCNLCGGVLRIDEDIL